MTSMNVLRQEAAAIGITDAEARKYGDLRHKRTWSLAIEHHLSMQDFADREALEEDRTASDSDSALSRSQTEESKDYGIQLTANLGESGVKTDNKTASGASLQQPGMAILFEGFANGRSPNNSDYRTNPNRGFKQVVQNHIKALTIASASRTIQLNSQLNNWVCPECSPEGESGCHLCAGEGNVSDIAAIGWTLAYMEMLGCSAREIEPLRKFSPASETLELNLKSCVAIKKSTEVLARTEKWVIQLTVDS
ncbi:MAG: hypothetical protein JGK30_00955 [Microcoleus sp. PH2017_40_RAT_O_B]|nr:hypothetical protein [Microcoleus sp. PH2017_34_RAT_O_A]MCC3583996.1 hypothetical protein [Microcoleus sp. PH2017_30_WIL_O_A]MCC3608104.1 hypothetical protein [Microcoleus sp. PH2017_40_RAT_O_B]